MKVQYQEIQIDLVMFSAQDVLTISGFDGKTDTSGFGDPNFN